MSNIGGFTPFDDANRQPSALVLLLSQTGTAAPTASILKGTLKPQIADTPLTLAFAYVSPGTFTATLVGAFPAGKVVSRSGIIDAATGSRFKVVRTSNDVVTITSYIADGTLTNGLFSSTPVTIEVF